MKRDEKGRKRKREGVDFAATFTKDITNLCKIENKINRGNTGSAIE